MSPIKCPSCGSQIQEWMTISATMPEETRGLLEETLGELRKEGLEMPRGKRLAMGIAIEALCANYLAGNRTLA